MIYVFLYLILDILYTNSDLNICQNMIISILFIMDISSHCVDPKGPIFNI